MYSLSTINAMNREAARKAKGQKPYVAKTDGDKGVFGCPNFGDRRPKSWHMENQYFVDNTGFGRDTELAMTAEQFLKKVKAGRGYAVISQGQFQVYIGEFVKVNTKQRRGSV